MASTNPTGGKFELNYTAEEEGGSVTIHVVRYLNQPYHTTEIFEGRMIDTLLEVLFPQQGGEGQTGQPPQGWTRRKESE